MVLEQFKKPLVMKELEIPEPTPNELLIQVKACGVCRTDLHIYLGELIPPSLPLILGHQVVGIVQKGPKKWLGKKVGIPWLGKTCQKCEFCLKGQENLCDNPIFTGFSHNGGFAEYCTADQYYVLELPQNADPIKTAPLLCAGLIGYRAFKMVKEGQHIGFYGFGSSAHLLIQYAKQLGKKITVFTRPNDLKTQAFAKSLGADSALGSDQIPQEKLDAALIFAPAGELYPQALKALKKGGKVVSAGIHMSDIPAFPYKLLWEERSMSSVANLTREDGHEFIQAVTQNPIDVHVEIFALSEANQALEAIHSGTLEGSAVLSINYP